MSKLQSTVVALAMPALNVPWSQWRAPRVANVIVSFCSANHIVQDCIKLKWVNRPLHVEVSKDISSAHIPFPGFSSRHTHAPVSTFSQQWNDYKSDHLDPCPWTPDFLDLANNSILFYKKYPCQGWQVFRHQPMMPLCPIFLALPLHFIQCPPPATDHTIPTVQLGSFVLLIFPPSPPPQIQNNCKNIMTITPAWNVNSTFSNSTNCTIPIESCAGG